MGTIFSGLKITNKLTNIQADNYAQKVSASPKNLYSIFTKKHNNRLFSNNLVPIKFDKLFDSLAPIMMGPASDI